MKILCFKIILLLFLFCINQLKKNQLKFISFFNIIDISIIIPIYNSEKYLSSCLSSVIMQSIKNIEIICIDDGSIDKSLNILENYKKIDNRIIILKQKNMGSAVARNRGIKMSRGKFLAFMDSDDLYPNKFTLEFMFKKAKKNKVLICGGGIITFIENKNKDKLLKRNISFFENNIIYFSDYQYDYYYQRFIYYKNFIQKFKLNFPNYRRFQDPPFFIKSMILAKKFYALVNITYYYRISDKYKSINKYKLIDIYIGILDCIKIAKSYKLFKLYYQVLLHLNSNFLINKAKKYTANTKLNAIISQILNNINSDLLEKENFIFIINSFYNKFNISIL